MNQFGGVSDYMSLFYSSAAVGGPAAISHATLNGINNAPMFKPLSPSAVIPTLPSTGIIPSGIYFSTNMTGGAGEPTTTVVTKPKPTGRWYATVHQQAKLIPANKLRAMCNKAGLSCRDKNGKLLSCTAMLSKLGLIRWRKLPTTPAAPPTAVPAAPVQTSVPVMVPAIRPL